MPTGKTSEHFFLKNDVFIFRLNQFKAEDGKTELSLIHFALTNPEWRPSKAAEGFLTALRSQIQQEMATNPMMFQPNIFASYSAMGIISRHILFT